MSLENISRLTFDLHDDGKSMKSTIGAPDFDEPDIPYVPEVSVRQNPPRKWELDVRGLVSSAKWLRNYGLRKARLTLEHLLPMLGFQHSRTYESSVKRPVSSRYANGLFHRCYRSTDGKIFNITVSQEKLRQTEIRILQAIGLFKRRLDWLTSESRRVFGVIEEHNFAIILDIRSLSPSEFDHYRSALERVILEQVSQKSKFNLLRVAEDVCYFQNRAVPVTADTIKLAIDWLWSLDRLIKHQRSSCVESLSFSLDDPEIEAIYLFTEGNSSAGAREILQERARTSRVPIHVVSYNCTDSYNLRFLRNLAQETGGRFHAYGVVMEIESYEPTKIDKENLKANIAVKKCAYGGMPSGAGMRSDVTMLYDELEEARNILAQIQALMRDTATSIVPSYGNFISDSSIQSSKEAEIKSDENLPSKAWLRRYGIRAKRLGLFDALNTVAFKHCDAVVDIHLHDPLRKHTDAVSKQKLVHAKYCDQFAHLKWKDGRMVHVHVTADMFRDYERKVKTLISQIQNRINWLKMGSREIFGTVVEEEVYFLLDISASMQPSIQFVKEKMLLLMQEQLRHKQRFNIVAFNSRVIPWKDRLTDVTEHTLKDAWTWIQGLKCQGSTNTLGATVTALADPNVQAIYLLTDGRPDQTPVSILAQVQLRRQIPVHTISFNCNDVEANEFLCRLASDTGGRYHYYSDTVKQESLLSGPPSWEKNADLNTSEDIRLLREELQTCTHNVNVVRQLRDECASLTWKSKQPLENSISSLTKEIGGFSLARRSMSADPSRSLSLPQGRKAHHTKTSHLRMVSSSEFSTQNVNAPSTELIHSSNQKVGKKLKIKERDVDLCPRRWIKRNGLKARRLTLRHLLAPTVIRHGKKYVPLLDKEVESKVFDAIFPFAHVTSSDDKTVRLINPSAVNFEAYERRLTDALAQYKRYLNKTVWKALSTEEQNNFKSEAPIDFLENREALLEALERLEWPVDQSEINLIEDEISMTQRYLQQAKELHEATLRKTPSPSTSILASKNEIEEETALYDAANKQNKEEQQKVRPVSKGLETLKGQTVVARYDKDGLYYPGLVVRCPDFRHVQVRFEAKRIGKAIIPTRLVLPISGAIAQPVLRLWDYVLVRVKMAANGDECFVPGVLEMTPSSEGSHSKLCSVRTFTGQKVISVRAHLIKIGKARFVSTVRYIDTMQRLFGESYEDEIGLRPGESQIYRSLHKSLPVKRNSSKLKIHQSRENHIFSASSAYLPAKKSRGKGKRVSIRQSRPESPIPSLSNDSFEDDKSFVSVTDRLSNGELDEATPPISPRSRSPDEFDSKDQAVGLHKTTHSREESIDAASVDHDEEDDVTEKTDNTAHLGVLKRLEEHHVEVLKLQRQLTEQITEQTKQQALLREETKRLMNMHQQMYADAHGAEDKLSSRGGDENTSPKVTDEVLAKWYEDGWYYRGTIFQDCGNDQYFVEDIGGLLVKVSLDDMISDVDQPNSEIQIGDRVLTLHPEYSQSYCPGTIKADHPVSWPTVELFDGRVTTVQPDEVFKISEKRFKKDVEYIQEREKAWIGQAVVSRNDSTGFFQLATIKEKRSGEFLVQFHDGSLQLQHPSLIFNHLSRRLPLSVGDKVLAVGDSTNIVYLPGEVFLLHDGWVDLKLYNGQKFRTVDPNSCFWISDQFYASAVDFLHKKSH